MPDCANCQTIKRGFSVCLGHSAPRRYALGLLTACSVFAWVSVTERRHDPNKFESGRRNRIKIRMSSDSWQQSLFSAAISRVQNFFVGVTLIRGLELPPKLPPKSPAALDLRRSLAIIVCRPIRVRHPYFPSVLARNPSLSDRPRSSPNIAN